MFRNERSIALNGFTLGVVIGRPFGTYRRVAIQVATNNRLAFVGARAMVGGRFCVICRRNLAVLIRSPFRFRASGLRTVYRGVTLVFQGIRHLTRFVQGRNVFLCYFSGHNPPWRVQVGGGTGRVRLRAINNRYNFHYLSQDGACRNSLLVIVAPAPMFSVADFLRFRVGYVGAVIPIRVIRLPNDLIRVGSASRQVRYFGSM